MKKANTADIFELHCLEEQAGLAVIDGCDHEETEQYLQITARQSQLPEDVYFFRSDDSGAGARTVFYHYYPVMNGEDKQEYIALKQLETQQKIHFWVRFWSILAISAFCAGLAVSLVFLLKSPL